MLFIIEKVGLQDSNSESGRPIHFLVLSLKVGFWFINYY